MDPVQTLLRPAIAVVNRNIGETSTARELCAELADSVVAVRVSDTALAAYFTVHDDCVELSECSDKEPDVVISGSLLSLSRMMINPDPALLRDGTVELTGNVEVAQRFQMLLKVARPDLEEEASTLVGDVAAHRLGSMARGLRRWSQEARATMGSNIREYLQEESRETPSRYEADEFSDNVGSLRDDVDRAEARLNRLRGDD